ncbi:MAG: hypothetical protein IPL70_03810 [Uliginosibacterium sp.]|nr:hypothetical protein [Uliginosibacterium sp.]
MDDDQLLALIRIVERRRRKVRILGALLLVLMVGVCLSQLSRSSACRFLVLAGMATVVAMTSL